MMIADFLDAGLIFLSVLGGAVTLASGVLAVMGFFTVPPERLPDALGFLVDCGVFFGFVIGLPPALALAMLRAGGVVYG
jgi:hypothetical protein